MAPICNLDIDFADQIAALLKPPSPQEVQAYFDELVATRQCDGLEVKHDGEFRNGVYANLEFREGELVLKDQMLFGVQHTSDKTVADHDDSGACPSSASKERIPIPREIVESLRNSELVLPYSKQFSLPSAIPCPGGCGEEHYCRFLRLHRLLLEQPLAARLIFDMDIDQVQNSLRYSLI